jgi:superfamily II DNA/RNA helicase
LVKSGREPFQKRETLRRLIRSADGLKNAIIFCNRKREVATLYRSLLRHGFSAIALHGDMDQTARMAALDQFRRGEVSLLVASDVAARGLDIPDVSHIFNFDVPHHPDDYVHRIGRTGRAGRSGTAITIVAPPDQKAVTAIEKLIGQSIGWNAEPPPTEETSEPVRFGSSRAARHSKPHGRRTTDKPGKPAADNVTPLEAARRRPPTAPKRERAEDAETHLPAFLLRPIRVKA